MGTSGNSNMVKQLNNCTASSSTSKISISGNWEDIIGMQIYTDGSWETVTDVQIYTDGNWETIS